MFLVTQRVILMALEVQRFFFFFFYFFFFYLHQCRTNIRKFPISFQGPKFFNSLSSEIRNATSTVSFCCRLKAFLLS